MVCAARARQARRRRRRPAGPRTHQRADSRRPPQALACLHLPSHPDFHSPAAERGARTQVRGSGRLVLHHHQPFEGVQIPGRRVRLHCRPRRRPALPPTPAWRGCTPGTARAGRCQRAVRRSFRGCLGGPSTGDPAMRRGVIRCLRREADAKRSFRATSLPADLLSRRKDDRGADERGGRRAHHPRLPRGLLRRRRRAARAGGC